MNDGSLRLRSYNSPGGDEPRERDRFGRNPYSIRPPRYQSAEKGGCAVDGFKPSLHRTTWGASMGRRLQSSEPSGCLSDAPVGLAEGKVSVEDEANWVLGTIPARCWMGRMNHSQCASAGSESTASMCQLTDRDPWQLRRHGVAFSCEPLPRADHGRYAWSRHRKLVRAPARCGPRRLRYQGRIRGR